jgi:predicted alpha/beta hydrolase family esterase
MKQTILIHGMPYKHEFYDVKIPSPSNSQWFPWIQKQLSLRDEISQALEMPRAFDPIYKDWVAVFENCKIDNETVLVGHSCGGGFLLKYLSEHTELRPKKVVLVAPWLDPEKEISTPFFDFVIDSKLTERTDIHIFISSDDFDGCLISFEIIKKALPNAHWHTFTDREHFCTTEFPELLEVLK